MSEPVLMFEAAPELARTLTVRVPWLMIVLPV